MIAISVVYFVMMIAAGHFFAPRGYRWTNNTISELAAQGHRDKFVMQAGFVGFGSLLNIGFVGRIIANGGANPADILVMLYGFAVFLSGFACTAPIDDTVEFSTREAWWHSMFAAAAGVCLSLGILGYAILAVQPAERWLHIIFLVLITGISLMFGLAARGKSKRHWVWFNVFYTWSASPGCS